MKRYRFLYNVLYPDPLVSKYYEAWDELQRLMFRTFTEKGLDSKIRSYLAPFGLQGKIPTRYENLQHLERCLEIVKVAVEHKIDEIQQKNDTFDFTTQMR